MILPAPPFLMIRAPGPIKKPPPPSFLPDFFLFFFKKVADPTMFWRFFLGNPLALSLFLSCSFFLYRSDGADQLPALCDLVPRRKIRNGISCLFFDWTTAVRLMFLHFLSAFATCLLPPRLLLVAFSVDRLATLRILFSLRVRGHF